jgi:saccharopine dehydrogenase (NADP+, L-glutamate forming)
MIVMQHQLQVKTDKGVKTIYASLVQEGEDALYTAMAKTVGLPLAIAVDLFLEGKIHSRGLQLPVLPELYLPILEKLKNEGISFQETIVLESGQSSKS